MRSPDIFARIIGAARNPRHRRKAAHPLQSFLTVHELITYARPPLMPHIAAGRLRPLAVSSAQRIDALRQVPTLAESRLESDPIEHLHPAPTPHHFIGHNPANASAWAVIKVPAGRLVTLPAASL